MRCLVTGIGAWGPGLHGWPILRQVLRSEAAWPDDQGERPTAAALPPAERRRATLATRVAITVAGEAVAAAGANAADLPSVFASSASNPDIIDEMCALLAAGNQALSPTKFHNSVHNSPAGYFGIAVGSRQASTSLCAFDASAAAGLLEAGLQCARGDRPVLLVSYDLPYPGPLGRARAVRDTWGVALVLAGADGPDGPDSADGAAAMRPGTTAAATIATITAAVPGAAHLTLSYGPRRPATALADERLEQARAGNPTARLLPLLHALANGYDTDIHLDTGRDATLSVRVAHGR